MRDTFLARISDLEKKYGQNPNAIKLFEIIRGFFEGKTDWDMEAIRLAAIFIEMLRVDEDQAFFSKSYSHVGTKAVDQHQPVLGTMDSYPEMRALLAGKYEFNMVLLLPIVDDFLELHRMLINAYHAPQWEYSFPKQVIDSNPLMQGVIHQWQSILFDMKKTDAAVQDFLRSVTIENAKSANADDVRSNLKNLLNKARAYDDEQKAVIEKWLLANGGQDVDRFINLMFMAGLFAGTSDPHYPTNYTDAQILKLNWTINEGGKVVLELEYAIKGVLKEGLHHLYLGKDGNFVNGTVELYKTEYPRGTDVKDIPPLLRIKANIRVDISLRAKTVRPTITQLVATSYTPKLENPEETLQTQPAPQKRL